MIKFLTLLLISTLLVGCAVPKQSVYKEANLKSENIQSNKKWSICRNGAFADQSGINFYLNGEYVTFAPLVFPGFTGRVDIVDSGSNSTLELRLIDKNNPERDSALAKFNRPPNYSNDMYIVIDSNTTGGWIIPLPFIVAHQLSGKRSINAVSKADFEKFCGTTSPRTFVK